MNGRQRSLRWLAAANLVLILRELSRISAKLNAEASRGASVTETTRAGRIRSKDVGSTCRYYKKNVMLYLLRRRDLVECSGLCASRLPRLDGGLMGRELIPAPTL